MAHDKRCRLYLVTPPAFTIAQFLPRLEQALGGGPVAALQLRLKDVPDQAVLEAAAAIKPLCAQHDVALIINDRADLALAADADGVHIGQTDGSVADARAVLGRERQIGVTCHDSRHLAMEAGEAGADYVAFGAFYQTATKAAPTTASPELLNWWQTFMELPCVAIGGITIDNAADLVAAGADFLAVSSGVWSCPDGPAAAVARFDTLFRETARVTS